MSLILDGTNGLSDVDGTAGTPAIRGSDANTGVFFGTDIVGVSTGGSERVRVDASGNVGIGTISPLTGLSLLKSGTQWTGNSVNTYPVPAGRTFVQMEAQASEANWLGFTGSYGTTSGSANLLLQANFNNTNQQAGNYIGSEATSASSAVLTFGTMIGGSTTGGNSAKSEKMRIDSSGNLLVGTTSSYGGMINFLTSSGRINAIVTRPATNITYNAADFQNSSGTGVGGIGVTSSSTAYVTSSDYRLKHDIQPMTGALAKVALLKPVTYKWNADNSADEGFIAHELQEVCPSAVTGEKDAVDAEGNPQYQGIDTSFLVATLTAAIQELKAINDAQAQTIESLTARVVALEGQA